jgi:peptidoglycan/xylan/chitin deacetylase (PgdA/CDA1 family)
VLAVMYHYVRDADPLPLPDCGGPFDGIKSLSTTAFEAQLDALGRAWEPIDWPRLYAWMNGRASIPQQCFLLTFDDGLLDHATNVAPALDSRGLRGVFFVPGSVLTKHRLLAPHANHLLLATLGERRVVRELADYLERQHGAEEWHSHLREIDGPGAGAAPAMYSYEQPLRARLKFFLTMTLPIAVRDAAIQAIFEEHIGSSARWAKHWYLAWKDVKQLEAAGHTIGGHGFAHEALARLSDGDAAVDVKRSAEVLRAGLGPDLRPFSYPYGSVGPSSDGAIAAAGFVHAFTTQEQWIEAGAAPYRLPRVDTIHLDSFLSPEESCQKAQ